MEAIRAFIAIELPEAVRRQLDTVEKQIQAGAGEGGKRAVRWVAAANMHLTLKFLGEVSVGNVQALASMLRNEAARHAPFEMVVGQLGAFPNLRRPRVIWVGTTAPPALAALQRAIEAETRHLGYPAEEREFSPHLTLGRIAQNARPDEVNQLARALSAVQVGELGRVRVDQIHLFQSDLRPSGAVYTPLYQFSFKSKA